MVSSARKSFCRSDAVAVVTDKAARRPAVAKVSTRSVFFTAWTAAALFGRSRRTWNCDNDDVGGDSNASTNRTSARAPDEANSLVRFRQATSRLALTEAQRARVDEAVSRTQPLIVQLRTEFREKSERLAALHPSSDGFIDETGHLSNAIGTLATQIALTSSQLKTDVYAVLTAAQQSVLDELQTAFVTYEPTEGRNVDCWW